MSRSGPARISFSLAFAPQYTSKTHIDRIKDIAAIAVLARIFAALARVQKGDRWYSSFLQDRKLVG
jgi:hypothetical protein